MLEALDDKLDSLTDFIFGAEKKPMPPQEPIYRNEIEEQELTTLAWHHEKEIFYQNLKNMQIYRAQAQAAKEGLNYRQLKDLAPLALMVEYNQRFNSKKGNKDILRIRHELRRISMRPHLGVRRQPLKERLMTPAEEEKQSEASFKTNEHVQAHYYPGRKALRGQGGRQEVLSATNSINSDKQEVFHNSQEMRGRKQDDSFFRSRGLLDKNFGSRVMQQQAALAKQSQSNSMSRNNPVGYRNPQSLWNRSQTPYSQVSEGGMAPLMEIRPGEDTSDFLDHQYNQRLKNFNKMIRNDNSLSDSSLSQPRMAASPSPNSRQRNQTMLQGAPNFGANSLSHDIEESKAMIEKRKKTFDTMVKEQHPFQETSGDDQANKQFETTMAQYIQSSNFLRNSTFKQKQDRFSKIEKLQIPQINLESVNSKMKLNSHREKPSPHEALHIFSREQLENRLAQQPPTGEDYNDYINPPQGSSTQRKGLTTDMKESFQSSNRLGRKKMEKISPPKAFSLSIDLGESASLHKLSQIQQQNPEKPPPVPVLAIHQSMIEEEKKEDRPEASEGRALKSMKSTARSVKSLGSGRSMKSTTSRPLLKQKSQKLIENFYLKNESPAAGPPSSNKIRVIQKRKKSKINALSQSNDLVLEKAGSTPDFDLNGPLSNDIRSKSHQSGSEEKVVLPFEEAKNLEAGSSPKEKGSPAKKTATPYQSDSYGFESKGSSYFNISEEGEAKKGIKVNELPPVKPESDSQVIIEESKDTQVDRNEENDSTIFSPAEAPGILSDEEGRPNNLMKERGTENIRPLISVTSEMKEHPATQTHARLGSLQQASPQVSSTLFEEKKQNDSGVYLKPAKVFNFMEGRESRQSRNHSRVENSSSCGSRSRPRKKTLNELISGK